MRFKRLISWIITLAMILSLMPVSVFADDDARGKLIVEYYTRSYWGDSEKVGVEIVDFDDEGDSLSIEDIIKNPDEYDVPKGYNITDKNFYFDSIRYNETTNNIELDKFGKYEKKYFFIADNGSQIGKSDIYNATGTVRVYVEEQTANQSNFYYELDPDITLGYWREGTDSSIQEVTAQSLGVQNGSIDADLYGNNCSEGIVFFCKIK